MTRKKHSAKKPSTPSTNRPAPSPTPDAPTPQQRARRARTTPLWLAQSSPDVNEIARRRSLMLLSVLSGETPVTTAIEREQISRQTYYLWETRALQAVLAAMVPTELAPGYDPAVTPEQRIASLERQLAQSERSCQRAERMLSLTRQAIRTVPVTTGRRGRPRTKASSPTNSTRSGSSSSRPSKTAPTTSAATTAAPSIQSGNSGATQ